MKDLLLLLLLTLSSVPAVQPMVAQKEKNWLPDGVWGAERETNEDPSHAVQESSGMQLAHEQDPNTKLLEEYLFPVATMGVHVFFPLMLAFMLYFGLVLWASSTLHRVDHHLYTTISELNAKTDQISEGLAALAQIYIDNYPFGYRSGHGSPDILQGASSLTTS